MLLARFGGPARGLESKSSDTDMVSDADREAEEAIAGLLAAERPEDGRLGEEGSSHEGSSGRRWVFDPLDGTTNFLYGHPSWCVSIALEDAAGGLEAVVHDAGRAETFTATRGSGARLNGVPVEVRGADNLARAMVATGFGYDAAFRRIQAGTVGRLLPHVRDIRRGGSAALDLAWTACGRLDGYWERGLKPWDGAAGMLLVTEAGGQVKHLAADDLRPSGVVAAGPELMPQLMKLVTEAETSAEWQLPREGSEKRA